MSEAAPIRHRQFRSRLLKVLAWATLFGLIWWHATWPITYTVGSQWSGETDRWGKPSRSYGVVSVEPYSPTAADIAWRGITPSVVAILGWLLLRTAIRKDRQHAQKDQHDRHAAKEPPG